MKLLKSKITNSELNKFLNDNRERSMLFLRQHYTKIPIDDIEDIYQESSIALFQKIQQGDLNNLSTSLYTYFLAICKNQALTFIRNNKFVDIAGLNDSWGIEEPVIESKFTELENLVGYELEDESSNQEFLNWVEIQVRESVRMMKPPCNNILWSYYWDGLSHKTIAEMYGMKSEDVSKTQASRCKQKFSSYLKSIIKNYEK